MNRSFRTLFSAIALSATSVSALTVAAPAAAASAIRPVSQNERALYGDILSMLDGERWTEAKSAILSLNEKDSLRPHLLAELYLAKNSPRVELFDLLDLLHKAPDIPQNERIASLARKRGAQALPTRPATRQLMWTGTSPQRQAIRSVKGDAAADQLRGQILQFIKDDQPAAGEALLAGAEAGLGLEGRTELRQRLAWSYFICGDTSNARRMAAVAVQNGAGEFLAESYWVMGLGAWREKQWNAAADAFYNAAMNTSDADLRSRSYFWAARATMADRKPQRVNALLRSAARDEESFYGMLARETLGLSHTAAMVRENVSAKEWAQLSNRSNVRNAVILASLGRTTQADAVLRYEASVSSDADYTALVHLASDLSLPATQLWLAQRSPNGRKSAAYARYPRPAWTPSNGWQVERALVFAHALQESRFQTDARSTADARGLMQVLPGTGADLARSTGMTVTPDQLYDPSVSLALGQAYLRKLSQMPATGGLLSKVVAAYNAGPTPVERWNVQIRDDGDPLLFIESVPYHETRGYLNSVLRNYWIYQMDENQGRSPALSAMAQGLWVRFPDGGKEIAVRVTPQGAVAGAR